MNLIMNRFDGIVALAVVTRDPSFVGEPIKAIIRREQGVKAITKRGPTVLKLLIN
jgi:hypothetical protein